MGCGVGLSLPSYEGKNTLGRTLLRGLIGLVPGLEDRNILGSTLELQTVSVPASELWLLDPILFRFTPSEREPGTMSVVL